ncbi:hypothetical protein C1645_825666 [Glomus cerebriforme]|uniref:Uncharacterized protein n=1 Tax=Glomus cerebriforme TaxID=658196 RepID=A0A397SYJ0_9GLOM|nr:hypothetical protein C1645_825666 [Glomus cerebriforme]
MPNGQMVLVDSTVLKWFLQILGMVLMDLEWFLQIFWTYWNSFCGLPELSGLPNKWEGFFLTFIFKKQY